MNNEKLCCGIDVSQNTLDVAYQNNLGEIFHIRVGNNNKGFETILEHTGTGYHFVMEATGVYYVRLACCVVDKDGLAIFIIQSKEFAEKDRPEIRLHTTNIEEVYDKVKLTHSELLHPNLNKVTLRPWGAKEFALRDKSNVCVIIQQW